MTLTTGYVQGLLRHSLGGGEPSIEVDMVRILNEAGHYLYSMHPWRWAVGRTALLDFWGSLADTTATWTAATSTLTETGAFTDYSFLSGDEIQILDGTGATTGVYKIASRTSANAIVLDGSISAVDLATGDISWQIHPQTIALPTDLRDIVHIGSSTETALYRLSLTTLEYILERRSTAVQVQTPALFYGAVVYSGQPPRPLLEIWPSPGANATGAMRLFYRSRWSDILQDSGASSAIPIPDFINDLYIFLVRAYAEGYERSGVASIHQRLAEIRSSPIFQAAKRSDGMVQPFHGKLQGGGARIWRRQRVVFDQVINLAEGPT